MYPSREALTRLEHFLWTAIEIEDDLLRASEVITQEVEGSFRAAAHEGRDPLAFS
jgi:hypothetical protein